MCVLGQQYIMVKINSGKGRDCLMIQALIDLKKHKTHHCPDHQHSVGLHEIVHANVSTEHERGGHGEVRDEVNAPANTNGPTAIRCCMLLHSLSISLHHTHTHGHVHTTALETFVWMCVYVYIDTHIHIWGMSSSELPQRPGHMTELLWRLMPQQRTFTDNKQPQGKTPKH